MGYIHSDNNGHAPNDVERPVMDHIMELATRLRRIFIAVIAMAVILSVVPVDRNGYVPLISYFPSFVISHVLPNQVTWRGVTYTVQIAQYNPFAGFNLLLKSALLLGILGSSPIIAREVYLYIEPALYQHEKQKLRRLTLVAVGLFLLGLLMAFEVVMPLAFKVMIITSVSVVGDAKLMAFTDVEQLFSTIILISVATGLAFETPLIVYLLVSFGILSPEWFQGDNLKFVLLASLILGAVISPDPSGIGMLLIGGMMFAAIVFAARLGSKNSSGYPRKKRPVEKLEETPLARVNIF